MRKLLILFALAAWQSVAQTNTDAVAQAADTNWISRIPSNTLFYSWRHPDWPPTRLPPDSKLHLMERSDGNFTVVDLDYDYPSDFGPQLQVFPPFHVNTNVLAGNTQAIAFARASLYHYKTNDLRLVEHRRRMNELFDWLEKQPRRTLNPTSIDYSLPVGSIGGPPEPATQSVTNHP